MLGELEESSHASPVEESKEVNSPISSKKSDKHIERIRELARRNKRDYLAKQKAKNSSSAEKSPTQKQAQRPDEDDLQVVEADPTYEPVPTKNRPESKLYNRKATGFVQKQLPSQD